MGPICTHRAIAKQAGIVWLDKKIIMAAATSAIVEATLHPERFLQPKYTSGFCLPLQSHLSQPPLSFFV